MLLVYRRLYGVSLPRGLALMTIHRMVVSREPPWAVKRGLFACREESLDERYLSPSLRGSALLRLHLREESLMLAVSVLT